MNPEVITLSEISQTQKVNYCTNLHLCEASRTDKFTETERKFEVARFRDGRREES